MWKKQQTSQHQICRQNIKHQKFIWEHHIWCHVKISEVSTLLSMIPNFWYILEVAAAELDIGFVTKVMYGGNALFFRWLLSLCYIINVWSYSSHLHHVLLRGPSEKVLISRFVRTKEQKSRLQCLACAMQKPADCHQELWQAQSFWEKAQGSGSVS